MKELGCDRLVWCFNEAYTLLRLPVNEVRWVCVPCKPNCLFIWILLLLASLAYEKAKSPKLAPLFSKFDIVLLFRLDYAPPFITETGLSRWLITISRFPPFGSDVNLIWTVDKLCSGDFPLSPATFIAPFAFVYSSFAASYKSSNLTVESLLFELKLPSDDLISDTLSPCAFVTNPPLFFWVFLL